MKTISYNIEAVITLLPTELGGLKRAICSGYRPDIGFNVEKQYSCEVELLGSEELKPGETARVLIALLPARTISENMKCSYVFSIREGRKIIGLGAIRAVNVALV